MAAPIEIDYGGSIVAVQLPIAVVLAAGRPNDGWAGLAMVAQRVLQAVFLDGALARVLRVGPVVAAHKPSILVANMGGETRRCQSHFQGHV